MVEVGGGWGRGGDGLCGQRSGSLASKGVYCNTGWMLFDKLIDWAFVLRHHNPKPKRLHEVSPEIPPLGAFVGNLTNFVVSLRGLFWES